MKLWSIIAGLALAGQTALGLTIPTPEDALTLDDSLDKRQSSQVVVRGVSGTVYPRLEVRQMQKTKPNQWTLLMLALKEFQQTSQSNKLSYYAISGIHGVPRMDYDGVGQCSACTGTDGYCPHDSILFLGWHRAYLALFEQEFMKVVNRIANSFPEARRPFMTGAASTMRFPYWDWAARPDDGQPSLPPAITTRDITVEAPEGRRSMVNPLFRHDFQSMSGLVYSPFVNWKVTLRWPDGNSNTASSRTSSVISAMDNVRPSLQDQIYQLFSTCTRFDEVGSDSARQSSSRCSNSIEGIHNTIHNTAGGPASSSNPAGHMTYLAVSAFDPIFWLHHMNVDRYFALWQAMNPNSYGGSQVAGGSTWTVARGSTQNADSPLTPFRRDTSGNFWTTNRVRDWRQFGYTYPEFANSDGSRAAISGYINRLYGPNASARAGSSKRQANDDPSSSDNNNSTSSDNSTSSTITAQDLVTPLRAQNGSLYQYVANIQTPRYALNGSYNILLFSGPPSTETPTTWLTDANLIGPMGVLAQKGSTAHATDLVAAGSVPLTRTLTRLHEAGDLPTLAQAAVAPWLKDNLTWRIAGPEGNSIDPLTVRDFNVTVFVSTATEATVDALPEWSEFVPLAGPTEEKAGGATKESIADAEAMAAVDPPV